MSIATYPPAVNGSMPSALLGHAKITAPQTGMAAGLTAIAGLSCTVFVPSGRTIKVTAFLLTGSTGIGYQQAEIHEDDVQVERSYFDNLDVANRVVTHSFSVVLTPTPGVHTYALKANFGNATGRTYATATRPEWILVEDISGGSGGPGPILLANAKIPANVSNFTADTQVASLTFSVPPGRTVRVSGHVEFALSGAGDTGIAMEVKELGVVLAQGTVTASAISSQDSIDVVGIIEPSAGTHTYTLHMRRFGGTGTISTAYASWSSFLVEDITGTSSPAGILPTSQTLAYAEATASQPDVPVGTTADVVGLSVTFTVPAGRRIKLTARVNCFASLDNEWRVDLKEGATRLTLTDIRAKEVTGVGETAWAGIVLTPSAGTHTYKAVVSRLSGTGSLWPNAGSTYPNWILVEDITGGAPAVPPVNVPVGVLAQTGWSGSQSIATPITDLPLSVNISVPAGRLLRITARLYVSNSTSNARSALYVFEGGAQLGGGFVLHPSTAAGTNTTVDVDFIISPTAGSHTYQLRGIASAGTSIFASDVAHPGFLAVEDITSTPAPANTAPSSTLGYAERISNQLNISAETDLTNLSVQVTVPAGRRLKITGYVPMFARTAGTATYVNLIVNEDGTNKQRSYNQLANNWCVGTVEWITSPTAGTHTYKLRANSDGTVAVDIGNSLGPAFILVEDITGVSVDVHDHNSAPASTLGYAQVTAVQAGITTITDLAGLSVTVTVPAGRRLKVTGYGIISATVATDIVRLHLTDGADNLLAWGERTTSNGFGSPTVEHVVSPAAGTHTFKLRLSRQSGTGTATLNADPAYPAFLLVEDISGHGIPGHTHPQLDGITDSGWITLPLINGWVSYDNNYGPPRYRKLNGIVYAQGLIKNGTLGVSCAQLPVGFRPSLPKLLFTVQHATGLARLDVQSDGHIIMAAANAGWTSLAGLTFPADL